MDKLDALRKDIIQAEEELEEALGKRIKAQAAFTKEYTTRQVLDENAQEIIQQTKAQHRSQMDDLLGLVRSARNYMNIGKTGYAYSKVQESVDYLEKYFELEDV